MPAIGLLAVADERLRVKHRRVVEDAHAGVQQPVVVEVLRRRARPVVRLGRDEEADAHPARRSALDPADHAAVGHVRVDDVERLDRAVEEARDLGRDRTERPRRVVQDAGAQRVVPAVERGEQRVELGGGHPSAEPAEARDEDELELRDDRAGDADEEVVEAAVLEVVLDPGAADPAGPAVDDDRLAMVDVAELGEVPAQILLGAEQPAGRASLSRSHDADLHPARGQPRVVVAGAALGIGAAAVDDETDGHALGGLRDQRRRRTRRRPGPAGSRTG